MKKYFILFLLLLTIPASANFYTHYAIPSFGPRWVVPSDIPAAEAQALMDLYFATSGNSWTNGAQGSGADAWGDTATADDWFGVTVVGGHVTAIEMPNNGLTGNIANTALPTTIETLDLGQNTGITDIDVSLLTAADNIDLAGCGFGSSVVAGILADIVTAGVSAGTLDIGGSNSSPNPAGVTSLLAIEDDSWTLTYSTVIMENTGSFYAITANGDATIRSSATDLSGQTAKYIVAYDGTNDKYAFAYGNGADDAEALGSELITGWTNMSTTSAYETLTVNANGHDIDSAINSADNGYAKTNPLSTPVGYLIKIVTEVTINSGTAPKLRVMTSGDGFGDTLIGALSGNETTIRTFISGETGLWLYNYTNFGDWSCLISAKKYTALGTDALQLRAAATGSTRNWTSIESGFDPNTISKIEVFNAE